KCARRDWLMVCVTEKHIASTEGTIPMSITDNAVRNGVDTATLFATLDAVRAAPEAAKFQFRASNRWVSGTHCQGTMYGFFAVGDERSHEGPHIYDLDHPRVRVGTDRRPTPPD